LDHRKLIIAKMANKASVSADDRSLPMRLAMALPNLWKLYNLRSSPYFQATLRQDSEATPLSLFVGRHKERQRLLSAIGGSRSSRQAVAGRLSRGGGPADGAQHASPQRWVHGFSPRFWGRRHLHPGGLLAPGALLFDGLHLIVVGSTDAVRTVVQSHTQVRSVFSDPVVLDPLEPSEVHQLLQARYHSLQLDPSQLVHSPVQAEVIDALHRLFRGDLRGLLKALEDGITALLGLTGNADGPGPIGLADLTQVLSRRYGLELQDLLGTTLDRPGAAVAAAIHTCR
jgi:hypothetical protein